MIVRDFMVAAGIGINARMGISMEESGSISSAVQGFRSDICIEINQDFAYTKHFANTEHFADAKDMVDVLFLGLTEGDKVTIYADGPDEQEAMSAIEGLAGGDKGIFLVLPARPVSGLQTLLGKAYINFCAGRYDQAIEDYTAALELNSRDAGALKINPGFADAYFSRGFTYHKKEMYDKAIEEYTAALGINPRYTDVYYNRGAAYFEKEMYGQAIEDFSAALGIDPAYANACYVRGLAYYHKGMHDQAVTDYTAALEIDPYLVDAYCYCGNAYCDKEMYDQAIADYTAALEIDPGFADAYFNRGAAYYQKGLDDQAIADLETAARLEPDRALDVRAQIEQIRETREY